MLTARIAVVLALLPPRMDSQEAVALVGGALGFIWAGFQAAVRGNG